MKHELEVGYPCEVIIEKAFGPCRLPTLRVSISLASGEWVIQRLASGDVWEEVARVPDRPEPEDVG